MAGHIGHNAFQGREHTKYKLQILEKYLPVWMQILQSRYKKLVYVDCFAGPGMYPDGVEGSPIRALKIARESARKWNCAIW
ncbi:MAG: three-Cys-motif partner protein TcmP, partial [Candidatus Thorarchaeota archaeon]